jgi:uncharacterized circularly permuted ATP-grasp superfamily protein
VLEDNLRVPSGVSYMLENRKMMMRLFPELFSQHRGRAGRALPRPAARDAAFGRARRRDDPTVVVLTPGMYNSAYFEHAFLAQQMGVELVEGQDLFVKDDFVYMRTTQGPKRVDVIYRRLDDDFLDPLVVPQGFHAGRAGPAARLQGRQRHAANAIGTGVADDKSIYPYVPEMIEFYLGEKPILNNVPTYQCRKPDDLAYVLANLAELVVKEVHGAGGYGMLVGPASTKAEIEAFRQALIANPGNYIAQPTLSLSTCPTYVEAGIAPRHIDLRPFVLSGKEVQMVPGGLTRVALKEGLAGGQHQPGRRHQGHLGAGGGCCRSREPAAATPATRKAGAGSSRSRSRNRNRRPMPRHRPEETCKDAFPHRRPPVLDVALHGARREHRAHARRQLPDRAAAASDAVAELGWRGLLAISELTG